ncbi:MAG: stalk domain-containing protein [Armatimonadota bacterium]
MSKRIIQIAVMLSMLVSFTSISMGADNVIIDTSGTRPFLYGGHSYVPLKSTASFLGAPLRWDTAKRQAVITYNGQDLALTPSNVNALFQGQPVVLSSPPVVVGGVTYVPTETFKKFYNVPVAWDKVKSEVQINGPQGRGTMKVSSRPPWHGGPPPWAPAWGERRKHQGLRNPLTPGNREHYKDAGKQKGKAKGK